MTNYEKIKAMSEADLNDWFFRLTRCYEKVGKLSVNDLAKWICDTIMCIDCPARGKCVADFPNALIRWFKSEAKENEAD